MVLFVLGEPGVGKTTLVRQLLYDSFRPSVKALTEPPAPKWTTVDGEICAAGYYRGDAFDGADTVPYNGAHAALMHWSASYRDWPLTIFDGARFSTRSSLALLRSLAPDHAIVGVHLVGGAEARRVQRQVITGVAQNATWIKGAATRAARFAQLIGATTIDTTERDAGVAPHARRLIDQARGLA